ncbi:hypothetical protein F2P56_026830 [Juglans regia]|uniref:Uncharacterized protein n=1 Tax=Juglans regia TaxID=51240 RepID=A0A833U9A4_JUGRE|nr:hypothetical protein F2P56_026830 [Juglans regia]
MYTYFGGVPTPMRVKYSPLPWDRPDMMELLNPPTVPAARLPFPTAASEVRALTLRASRWSLRWKSCSGLLSRDNESKWRNWRVVVEAASGSCTVDSGSRESDSGHERVCVLEESGLRTRFWY